MIDLNILDERGINTRSLREIFTASPGENGEKNERHETRKRIEDLLQARIQDGVKWGLKISPLYHAVDIGWDSQPVQTDTVPLLMLAMGKIDAKAFAQQVKDLGAANKYCTFAKDGSIKEIDIPPFWETNFNLIRSVITRRHAAQSSRFSNLWPYFRYEPNSTTTIGKLRGDVMSQYAEGMVNAYNYRHFFSQCMRDMFLYGHTVAFPLQAWDRKVQWRGQKLNTANPDEAPYEAVVEKEGLDFTNPHPTRVFWDRAAPLANVNTNTGPEWIGYWDLLRYSTIKENDEFWNVKSVAASTYFPGLLATYKSYFSYYYSDPKVMNIPTADDPNDRVAAAQKYTETTEDQGVMVTTVFMRLNPKKTGIGDYPFPVWFRFVVGSDNTVLFAEPMPSLPALYGGINEHDGRAQNISTAHGLMPYQDQLTQILTHLRMRICQSFLQIWLIDEDAIEKPVKDYITGVLGKKNFYVEPVALWYSGAKMKDIGTDPANMIRIIRAEMQAEISAAFDSIMKLLAIVDRLENMSPNELGQPNPREVAAREVQEIATSVSSIYSFISDGIDEMRSAAKRLIYESSLMCATADVRVPVIARYTEETVRAAGFEPFDDGEPNRPGDPRAKRITVTGSVGALEYDYYFSSRDGAERASNTQAAQVLTQLAQFILSAPNIAQAIGKERLFEMFNEIFRLSGAAFDLRLELEDAESPDIPPPEGAGNRSQQPDQSAALVAQLRPILAEIQSRLVMLEKQAGGGPQPQPEASNAALAVMSPTQ